MMKITILTDNPKSWIIPYIENLKEELIQKHEVTHIFSSKDIAPGDVMLILSCEKILKNTHLSFHKSNNCIGEKVFSCLSRRKEKVQ